MNARHINDIMGSDAGSSDEPKIVQRPARSPSVLIVEHSKRQKQPDKARNRGSSSHRDSRRDSHRNHRDSHYKRDSKGDSHYKHSKADSHYKHSKGDSRHKHSQRGSHRDPRRGESQRHGHTLNPGRLLTFNDHINQVVKYIKTLDLRKNCPKQKSMYSMDFIRCAVEHYNRGHRDTILINPRADDNMHYEKFNQVVRRYRAWHDESDERRRQSHNAHKKRK